MVNLDPGSLTPKLNVYHLIYGYALFVAKYYQKLLILIKISFRASPVYKYYVFALKRQNMHTHTIIKWECFCHFIPFLCFGRKNLFKQFSFLHAFQQILHHALDQGPILKNFMHLKTNLKTYFHMVNWWHI